jgi:very-short-patch-repair endonuclease
MKHSEETKLKISKARIAYLTENPDKVPYKLNHSSKESYPETYFKQCLPNFLFQYHIPETLYTGDFVNPDLKYIIEIDGDQHYLDQKQINHDIKRTEKLIQLGWNVVRIKWSDFQKLDKIDKEEIVNKLNKYEIIDFDISRYTKPKPKCIDCCKILSDNRSTRCIKHSNIVNNGKHKKFDPTKEELEKLVLELPFTEVGKIYGVSDNAIRHKYKTLNINYKKTKEEIRQSVINNKKRKEIK